MKLSFSGSAVSLSSDGAILVVGGHTDTFGFIPNSLALKGYSNTAEGIGATWIFASNGSVYHQAETRVVGKGYVGSSEQGEQDAVGESCYIFHLTELDSIAFYVCYIFLIIIIVIIKIGTYILT